MMVVNMQNLCVSVCVLTLYLYIDSAFDAVFLKRNKAN